jgi:Rps23 Pro-64 3,4-dihydroxylase Tpa1-like proline 4-hydroxylase
VDFESYHFVTHVTPFAQSKRLSINGWWTGKPPANAPQELRQPPGNDRRIVEIV